MKIYRYTFFAILTALTACADSDFSGPTTSDEISFSVTSTSSWQELSRGASKGYNVKDAMLKLDDATNPNNSETSNSPNATNNTLGPNGKIYAHSEPTPPLASGSEASRASAIGTADLQSSGFNVYAVVKEKSSGAETLLMNNNPLTYSGGSWTYSPTKYWPSTEQYTTTFYGYIPSQFTSIDDTKGTIVPEGVYTVPTEPTQQKDIIAARYIKNDRQTVNLTFEHLLTTVKLRFRNVRSAVTKVEISGIYDSADFSFLNWTWSNQRTSDSNTGGVFSYTFLPTQFVSYAPDGEKYLLDANGNDSYFMMIPQTINDNARLLITFENGTQINTKLNMNDSEGNPVDWEPGKTVTYTIDYTDAYVIYLTDSNCYIINPKDTSNNPDRTAEYWYAIPISWRINTFWQNENGTTPLTTGFHYAAVVLWQDEPNKVIEFVNTDKDQPDYFDKVVDSDNEYVYFKLKYPDTILPTSDYPSNTCNIVIGVRSVDNNDYLWSWHLWLTKYSTQPAESIPSQDFWALQTHNGLGHILRYGEAIDLPDELKVWSNRYKDKYMMDRNIGAGTSAINSSPQDYWESFGMYYQWGRKDPFPPNGKIYDINGNQQGELTDGGSIDSQGPFKVVSSPKAMTVAVNNPCTFFGGTSDGTTWMDKALNDNWNNPDWYEPGKGTGKSFYDPSPPGWQIPAPGVWDIFQKGQTYQGENYYEEKPIITTGDEGAFCKLRESDSNSGLIVAGDLLGYAFYRNPDTSQGQLQECTTDYGYWGLRRYDDGSFSYSGRGNSGVWTCAKNGDSSAGVFFQYMMNYNGNQIVKLRGIADPHWGIQIRSIHQ